MQLALQYPGLVDRLAVRELHVGSGFVFGRDREGDLSLLRAMGSSFGFAAFGCEEVLSEGAPISSTRIRAAVAAGEMEAAAPGWGRSSSRCWRSASPWARQPPRQD